MAGQTTKPYRNTLSGSIGAGMGSIFSPGGRKYYILEHKVSSKYHRAGESQEIIVNNIELGRDSHCQVRFDDSFKTVSRHHAGIVKDGDMWKLVQISKTNSTFLNGRPVKTEWYLQNGDEIQLSVNGPKLGFILPTGKKSTVGSIGLTRRLSLFRQQALRPYKTAIASLACMLAFVCIGGGYMLYYQSQQIKDNSIALEEARKANAKNEQLIAEQKRIIGNQGGILDSLKKVKPQTKTIVRVIGGGSSGSGGSTGGQTPTPSETIDMSACHPYIYHITAHLYVNGEELTRWNGTGFQLQDGKFVTARHVVVPYYSNSYHWEDDRIVIHSGTTAEQLFKELLINALAQAGQVQLKFVCVSPANTIQFTNSQFADIGKYDEIHTLANRMNLVQHQNTGRKAIIEGDNISSEYKVLASLPAGTKIRDGALGALDFAYASHSGNGGLKANRQLSSNMKQGTQLYILGYPHGWGKGKPIFSTAVCSQDGLSKELGNTIMVSNNNTEGGNSGGPIFVKSSSGFEVVALVSGSNYAKGRFVPISVIP